MFSQYIPFHVFTAAGRNTAADVPQQWGSKQRCIHLRHLNYSKTVKTPVRVTQPCCVADGAEHLKPETTANPALHRFFAFMAYRALDPDAQLPAHDLQVQHTLSCPFGHKDQAQAALSQLSEHFHVQQQVWGT